MNCLVVCMKAFKHLLLLSFFNICQWPDANTNASAPYEHYHWAFAVVLNTIRLGTGLLGHWGTWGIGIGHCSIGIGILPLGSAPLQLRP